MLEYSFATSIPTAVVLVTAVFFVYFVATAMKH